MNYNFWIKSAIDISALFGFVVYTALVISIKQERWTKLMGSLDKFIANQVDGMDKDLL